MHNHAYDHDPEKPAHPHDAAPTRKVKQPVFQPRAYLTQYYTEVDAGNQALLRFYAQVYQDLAGRSLLEFGGGPTLYSLITAARTAGWIHFCDYNVESLREAENWLARDPSAFDWLPYIRFALACETGDEATPQEDMHRREDLIRQKIKKVSRCDIFATDPLLGNFEGPYGVVAQTFVLDDLTEDKGEWLHLNQKLAQLVAEHGLFVTVSLLRASYWTVQGKKYPAVSLIADDVSEMYATLGFSVTALRVEELAGKIGYDGFIMACGQRL